MNCSKCAVEIAAQSSIGGRCARCAADAVVAPVVGSVPVKGYQDTTLPSFTMDGPNATDPVISYEDVKQAYEEENGPAPTVRKKGK